MESPSSGENNLMGRFSTRREKELRRKRERKLSSENEIHLKALVNADLLSNTYNTLVFIRTEDLTVTCYLDVTLALIVLV